MGVNCKATLTKADWRTVGMVASILLGRKATMIDHGSYKCAELVEGGSKYAAITGKVNLPKEQPEYIDLFVLGDPANAVAQAIIASDGPLPYRLWYNMEDKSVYPRATAAKIALTLGLVKFFGGTIEYNDCIGKRRSYPPPSYIGAEDNGPWARLQSALVKLKPLTEKDVQKMAKWAAY